MHVLLWWGGQKSNCFTIRYSVKSSDTQRNEPRENWSDFIEEAPEREKDWLAVDRNLAVKPAKDK